MIFRSPYPDIAIPKSPLTPVVLRHAARLGDKPALIDGASGRVLTYSQLAERRSSRRGRIGTPGLPEGRGPRDLRAEHPGVRRRFPRRRRRLAASSPRSTRSVQLTS